MNQYVYDQIISEIDRIISNGGFLLFLIWFIQRTIIGILCFKLAEKKGYGGYFFTGALLGILGFVYVICLPDLKMQKYAKMCSTRIQKLDQRVEQLEEWQAYYQ
ncbi:MAG: hypothetical protein ACLVB5_03525 [Christensenellales bacterium]